MPTDIIAFSYRENPFPKIDSKSEPLGDIYISLEKASENARIYEIAFENEVKRLIIHGVLHLTGYDHDNSNEEKKMKK